jgi:LPS sulfotransferase NodH
MPLVIDRQFTSQAAISCFIATTPWAGSQLLCRMLRATELVGHPRDYFNPLEVVRRSQEWGLFDSGEDFAPRYLDAVAESAMGDNNVLSVNLPWSHQRWLSRFAREASPDPAAASPRSDAEVIAAWYPRTRYLYLTRADKARQAASWYLGRQSGSALVGGAERPGHPPDFQEVRWIETLIARQEKAWESYFQLHAIGAHRIEYEALLERPEETVAEILGWLRLPDSPARAWSGEVHRQRQAEPAAWLPDYLAQREQLSTIIGVRQG